VQIDVTELGDDEVEDVRLAHPLDLVLELEEVEEVANVPREALDVADEVLLDVVGIPPPLRFLRSARTLAFVGASTQSNRRSTVIEASRARTAGAGTGPRSRSTICQIRPAK
jgi:hypothetical protein